MPAGISQGNCNRVGFAGARVIKQTIGQDLPDGFQTSEFLLEHGFLDMIARRNELKRTVALVLTHLVDGPRPEGIRGSGPTGLESEADPGPDADAAEPAGDTPEA